MAHADSYRAIVSAAERATFRVDDVLPADATFDLTRAFLPDSLARTRQLTLLDPHERLALNQIRAAGYLGMFGLVEEFILPFVVDHAQRDLGGDVVRTRALLNFASEEAKHIALFARFLACFARTFPTATPLIGPSEEIGRAVLARSPLAVALLILQIEWMTQRHYVESVRDDDALEPRFKALLKVHWMEEAQHAKLDALMVRELAARLDAPARERAVSEYEGLVHTLDTLLAQQCELDLVTFARATGRILHAEERALVREVQLGALRWTYLGSGMTHPQFVAALGALDAPSAARVTALARNFC